MDSNEFRNALGSLILNAAHIEYSVRTALITLCSNLGFIETDLFEAIDDPDFSFGDKMRLHNRRLASALIVQSLQMSKKIELLSRVIKITCSGQALSDWEELVSDLEELTRKRNGYIHGMYGVEEGKLIRLQLTKGKKGSSDYYTEENVVVSEIEELVIRLEDRHRQLMDFIEDYPIKKSDSWMHVPKSQIKHPRLTF